MLQKGERPLIDVAQAAGYYDQPHMNAEFRELSGLAPREFLAARYPTGDGNTVARFSTSTTANLPPQKNSITD